MYTAPPAPASVAGLYATVIRVRRDRCRVRCLRYVYDGPGAFYNNIYRHRHALKTEDAPAHVSVELEAGAR